MAPTMTSLKSSIDILRKAQDLDREIYQAGEALKHGIPEERAHLKHNLESEKTHLKQLEENLKAVQMKQKQKEGALSDKEANIRKMDGQLSQVKTNKEYAALQQEIATLKADNSLLEEEIIKMFDEVTAAETLVKTERERLKKIEHDFSVRDAELAAKEKQSAAQVDEMKKKREEILKQVSEDVRDRYNLIISKKQGLALVRVKGENCGACHYQLRPQMLNEVRISTTLVMCENCARILYFEDAAD